MNTSAGSSRADDSTLDSRWIDQVVPPRGVPAVRWMGWRMRGLVLLALLGSVALFALLRVLSASAQIDASWRPSGPQGIELQSSPLAALQAQSGQTLTAIVLPDGQQIEANNTLLRRSPRWLVDDAEREHQIALQEGVAQALAQPRLTLRFENGASIAVAPTPRGFSGLGAMFWLLIGLALVLYLVGMVVVLSSPRDMNLLFALMALCQSGNLTLISIEALGGIGMAAGFTPLDQALRTAFDIVTGAAILHACVIHPLRLPRANLAIGIGWVVALGFIALAWMGSVPQLWWWTQALLIGYGGASVLLLGVSYRLEPHPFAIVLRRLGGVATGTLV
ncbi:MAG: histidine kinase, partial [Burkholderiales bacterium]|nr:histidine kinase [Burkholderiales bacterium]